MKQSFAGLFLCLLSSIALSQDGTESSPVTITTGYLPLVFNGEESTFASITITENYPTALRDGYFVVHGNFGIDKWIGFTSASAARGSVVDAPIELVDGAQGIRVQVDAEDDRLDKIVVTPHGPMEWDYMLAKDAILSPVELIIADRGDLRGPDVSQLIPEGGRPAGLNMNKEVTFAINAGNGGITIGAGSSVAIKAGETVTFDLTYEGSVPTIADSESLDSSVATVDAHTRESMTVTAHKPGETAVFIWSNPGASGYMHVDVVEEQRALTDVTLPHLETAVMGSGDTTAHMAAGASADQGTTIDTTFAADETIVVEGEIIPEAAHIEKPGDLFIAVRVILPNGAQGWFYKTVGGNFVPWDRDLGSLHPAREVDTLADLEVLDVYQGGLAPGEYRLYLGYMPTGGSLIYSKQPLGVTVLE